MFEEDSLKYKRGQTIQYKLQHLNQSYKQLLATLTSMLMSRSLTRLKSVFVSLIRFFYRSICYNTSEIKIQIMWLVKIGLNLSALCTPSLIAIQDKQLMMVSLSFNSKYEVPCIQNIESAAIAKRIIVLRNALELSPMRSITLT